MPYNSGATRLGAPGNPMAGGPIPAQQPMVYRRPSPYGNPRQMMLQRKQQYTAAGVAGPGGVPSAVNHVSKVPRETLFHHLLLTVYHTRTIIPSLFLPVTQSYSSGCIVTVLALINALAEQFCSLGTHIIVFDKSF